VRNYALRRALINIPVIWLVATMVFIATSVLPGDFVAQRIAIQNPISDNAELRELQLQRVHEDLGLDQPLPVRYVHYLADLATGDFGTSFETRRPALQGFRDGLPYTLQLTVLTLVIVALVSVPIGVLSAVRQDSVADYLLRIFSVAMLAAPNFWLATLGLLYVVRFGLWDVPITARPLLWEDAVGSMKLFGIPAIVGGVSSGAPIMRLLRSQMLEVMRQDYVRTAWAKGLRERSIVMRHALKNALIPATTLFGLTIASLLSGNVVFEYIFNIPGIGSKTLRAINARDVPVLQAFVLVVATFVVFANLAVDLLYVVLDPRIRFS
jgi:peptide/nickel transport system permease protein